ncbi:MAG: FG-GAP repeat protein [Chthoniobacterales bacterium]
MKNNTGEDIAPQNEAPSQGGQAAALSRLLIAFVLCALGAFMAKASHAASITGMTPPFRDAAQVDVPLSIDPLVSVKGEFAANDGAAGDSFGYSVALQGTTAVVSAPAATVGGNQAQGAVYVFRYANATWTEMQKITANDGAAFDNFGNSVAFDGKTMIVGAPDAAVNGNAGQGAAYIFTESGGIWIQTQKLLATDGAFGNEFGDSVAIQGGTALIGAIQLLHGPGAAYIFNNSGGTWSQSQKLTATGGSTTFGDAVALDGDNALIGAQQTSVGGFFDQGAAFVFANQSGAWTETAELLAGDGTMFDSLGSSVALQGSTALVGAPGTQINGSQIGAAYVFSESGGKWSQTQRITASDAQAEDGFGSSVALSGSMALIGADQYASNGTGKAYVFDNSGDMWTQMNEVRPANANVSEQFGWSTTLDQTDAIIGAWGATVNGNAGQGAVYFGKIAPRS